MTPEEAAEIILGGEEWVFCRECQKPEDFDAEKLFGGRQCHACEGSGAEISPRYREACEVLRRPPPPIWRYHVSNGMQHKTGPVIQAGQFGPTKPKQFIIYKPPKKV